MITLIDTNVLVALWDMDATVNVAAEKALHDAQGRGALLLPGAVYAELLALPGRNEQMLDAFVADTGIRVEWALSEEIWRAAGRAFQGYASRRKTGKAELPRRILADFLIGAQASVRGWSLLTLDHRLYRAAFPGLEVLTF